MEYLIQVFEHMEQMNDGVEIDSEVVDTESLRSTMLEFLNVYEFDWEIEILSDGSAYAEEPENSNNAIVATPIHMLKDASLGDIPPGVGIIK